MDRAEKVGLGIAVVGHGLLFALLSLGFLADPAPPPEAMRPPVEVSLVDDVALEAAAPQAVEPPAQSVAPEQGAPEEAAAAMPEEAAPQPEAAPPRPAPDPKPAPAAKPAPAPKPVPQPRPAPRPQPAAKPAAPARTTAKPAAAPARAAARPPAQAAAKRATGTSPTATAARPRGSRLGSDFLKGLTSDPSPSRSELPRAARIDARALAGIQDAISRQIQPCADRQVDPGPGANRIVTVLNLRLNENGTLAATPTMVRQTGVDGDNDRYARRVVDLGIAAFKGCSPLRLPAEFYATPGGGWNNINYRWQLR
jgi:outer membrane biosynthesis protein TonB